MSKFQITSTLPAGHTEVGTVRVEHNARADGAAGRVHMGAEKTDATRGDAEAKARADMRERTANAWRTHSTDAVVATPSGLEDISPRPSANTSGSSNDEVRRYAGSMTPEMIAKLEAQARMATAWMEPGAERDRATTAHVTAAVQRMMGAGGQ